MSYLQNLLNRRLGIQEDFIQKRTSSGQNSIIKKEEPREQSEPSVKHESPPAGLEVQEEIINKVEEPKQEEKSILESNTVPKPKRNPRGAGRKKVTKELKEQRKEETVNELTAGQKDLETIQEIKSNASHQEIKEEIKIQKKRLKLLSDSLNFIE